MDALGKRGLLAPGTRKALLSNSLVVVVAADATSPLQAIPDLTRPEIRQLALTDTETAPAGMYAGECAPESGLGGKRADKEGAEEQGGAREGRPVGRAAPASRG